MGNKFGDFISEKRKAKQISLRKMADMLELSPAYWSDIEKGRRNPPNIEKIKEIAEILGISNNEVDDLIDMASYDRDEMPMDFPKYIREDELVRVALRKARKNMDEGKSQVTKKAWEDFIKALDNKEE